MIRRQAFVHSSRRRKLEFQCLGKRVVCGYRCTRVCVCVWKWAVQEQQEQTDFSTGDCISFILVYFCSLGMFHGSFRPSYHIQSMIENIWCMESTHFVLTIAPYPAVSRLTGTSFLNPPHQLRATYCMFKQIMLNSAPFSQSVKHSESKPPSSTSSVHTVIPPVPPYSIFSLQVR